MLNHLIQVYTVEQESSKDGHLYQGGKTAKEGFLEVTLLSIRKAKINKTTSQNDWLYFRKQFNLYLPHSIMTSYFFFLFVSSLKSNYLSANLEKLSVGFYKIDGYIFLRLLKEDLRCYFTFQVGKKKKKLAYFTVSKNMQSLKKSL